jgi:heptosyltransferase I
VREAPRGVLVIRLSAIGDLVMASPLAASLKSTWPGARLTWLVEDSCEQVIAGHPAVDRVLVWPRRRWKGLARRGRWLALLREARAFVRELRGAGPYDLALDAQGLAKSGVMALLSGARERVGLGSREGSGLLMTRVVGREGANDRIGSQYLLMAQELGLVTTGFLPHLEVGPRDAASADGVLAGAGVSGPYATLFPFTTRPQKHWLAKRWVEVASHLLARGLTPVILGGPGDEEEAELLAASCAKGTVSLAGKTSIKQAAGVIARARLAVGVDTGLTHMGVALATPTVALFLSTRPYLDTGGRPAVILHHPLPCSPCRRRPTCEGRFECQQALTAEEVTAAADRLLGTSST